MYVLPGYLIHEGELQSCNGKRSEFKESELLGAVPQATSLVVGGRMVVLETRLLFLLGPRVPWVEPLAIILVSALPTGQVETPWTEFDVVVHEWRSMTVVTVHLLASSGKTKNVIPCRVVDRALHPGSTKGESIKVYQRLSEFIGVHQPFSCNSSRGILSRVIPRIGHM